MLAPDQVSDTYIGTMQGPVGTVRIERADGGVTTLVDDLLVTEEPLEIRLGHGPLEQRSELRLSVTMRTPGHDEELALGFLFTEGLISSVDQVLRVEYCRNVRPEEQGNVVRAELHPAVVVDPERWQRNTYTTSSCGVCGKTSIDAVEVTCSRPQGRSPELGAAVVQALPERMRAAQMVFKHTGGIHAAALFDGNGELLFLREDIGRHNALDKVMGALLQRGVDSDDLIMVVSGRAGFELVQKCAVVGIPVMISVGAPSTLAVRLARQRGMHLIGFVRDGRYNSYSPERK